MFTKKISCLISGALAWNADMLSSGSRDRLILQRDIRTPSIVPERRLTGHKQEVGTSTHTNRVLEACYSCTRILEKSSVASTG